MAVSSPEVVIPINQEVVFPVLFKSMVTGVPDPTVAVCKSPLSSILTVQRWLDESCRINDIKSALRDYWIVAPCNFTPDKLLFDMEGEAPPVMAL